MTTALKIDFVSDIACPWCAVGLGALEQALNELQNEVKADIHFQPFELNPHMPEGGEDLVEHLGKKYGSTADQQAQMYQNIKARGAEVGFAFHPTGRGRIFNTFDAHRLLHWAELEGAPGDQHKLKKAFLEAYQGRGEVIESMKCCWRSSRRRAWTPMQPRPSLKATPSPKKFAPRKTFTPAQAFIRCLLSSSTTST